MGECQRGRIPAGGQEAEDFTVVRVGDIDHADIVVIGVGYVKEMPGGVER